MKKMTFKFMFLCAFALFIVSCNQTQTDPPEKSIGRVESSESIAAMCNQIIDQIDPQDQADLVNSVMGLSMYGIPNELLGGKQVRSAKSAPEVLLAYLFKVSTMDVSIFYGEYTYNMLTSEWEKTASDSALILNYSVPKDFSDMTKGLEEVSIEVSALGDSHMSIPVDSTLDFTIPKNLKATITYGTKTVLVANLTLDFPEESRSIGLNLNLSGYVFDIYAVLNKTQFSCGLDFSINESNIATTTFSADGDFTDFFSSEINIEINTMISKLVEIKGDLSVMNKKVSAEISCSEISDFLVEVVRLQEDKNIEYEAMCNGICDAFNTYVKSSVSIESSKFAKIQLQYMPYVDSYGDSVRNNVVGLYFTVDNTFVDFKSYFTSSEFAATEEAWNALTQEFMALFPMQIY